MWPIPTDCERGVKVGGSEVEGVLHGQGAPGIRGSGPTQSGEPRRPERR